ncbi:hypothetical protein ZWY2020_019671 [Hordeum vulgare]|nr:hypothetical protein ZWY2020_019671 [Hordeum vulgare]
MRSKHLELDDRILGRSSQLAYFLHCCRKTTRSVKAIDGSERREKATPYTAYSLSLRPWTGASAAAAVLLLRCWT